MHHPHIIGLTGPAGSGKDTVADTLVTLEGFTKMSFAGALKSEVVQAFGIDMALLERRETKEKPSFELAIARCADKEFITRMIIMHTLMGLPLDLDAPRSPRQIMQWWGTDYRRYQSTGYWVRRLLVDVSQQLAMGLSRRIVVTDCRFASEVDAIRRMLGGQIWQICRDGVTVAPGAHVSEVTGAEFRPDVVINNSHSVKHLQERVLEAYGVSCAGRAADSLSARILA